MKFSLTQALNFSSCTERCFISKIFAKAGDESFMKNSDERRKRLKKHAFSWPGQEDKNQIW